MEYVLLNFWHCLHQTLFKQEEAISEMSLILPSDKTGSLSSLYCCSYCERLKYCVKDKPRIRRSTMRKLRSNLTIQKAYSWKRANDVARDLLLKVDKVSITARLTHNGVTLYGTFEGRKIISIKYTKRSFSLLGRILLLHSRHQSGYAVLAKYSLLILRIMRPMDTFSGQNLRR
jgi:hypothetical protein